MLSLFRTNQLILGVFLLGYAMILRFWLLFGIGQAPQPAEFPLLSGWLWDKLDQPYWLSAFGATLLVWLQALLINAVVARNRMAAEINLFPGFFFILVASALPAFQDFTPFHLANTFLILAISQMFRVYKQNSCMDYLFNSGLFIGLASLCYGPYILFLIPLLIGLNILRAFQVREWLSVIIGSFIPLLWLGIYSFWKDQFWNIWEEWSGNFGFVGIHFNTTTPGEMIGLSLYGLLILWVLLNYGDNLQKTIIEVRKKIDILYWVLFFAIIATLFTDQVSMANFLMVSVAAGILLSLKFTRMKAAGAEILHWMLLIGVLVIHYLTYTGLL